MAQSRGICPQVVWKHSSAQIAVRDKENRVFLLEFSIYSYELQTMITNDAHAHTNPPPLRDFEPESKKIGFVAPILKFPSAKISKTINMLCIRKHSTTNVIRR